MRSFLWRVSYEWGRKKLQTKKKKKIMMKSEKVDIKRDKQIKDGTKTRISEIIKQNQMLKS